jgi:hypothetical protein
MVKPRSRSLWGGTKKKIAPSNNAGSISHSQAEAKAKLEYQKYKAKTLEKVEEEYLKAIGALEHQAKTESKKKRGKE